MAVFMSLLKHPNFMACWNISKIKGPKSSQNLKYSSGGIQSRPGDLPWFMHLIASYNSLIVNGESSRFLCCSDNSGKFKPSKKETRLFFVKVASDVHRS